MSPPLPRRRFHRVVFVVAGLYNIAWGLWAAIDPWAFFRWLEWERARAGLAATPPNHPEIFACLGMVIGLYGLLYLEVARRPAHGWPIAAVGLLGKLLGPIGALLLIAEGDWPWSSLWLCVFNDFIWWIPFGLYLRDAWPAWRASFARG